MEERFDLLKSKASKSFDKYMKALLDGTDTYMLPKERMSDKEWEELNSMLIKHKVKLVPVLHRDNHVYMQFTKLEKKKEFEKALALVKVQQFNYIRTKYPNLSDEVVKSIVDRQDDLDIDDIYDMLRHKKKPYKQSKSDFLKAVEYGKTPSKNINVFSYQHWTWSRTALKNKENRSEKYHISLNVNVAPGLMRALDEVLAQDAGNYISYYKFPKQDFYDEVISRYDPITIYLYDRNPKVEQAIVKAVAPYVRSNEGLLGEQIGKGVDINKETTYEHGMSVGQYASMQIYKALQNIRQNN